MLHGNDGDSWVICLRNFAEEFSAVEAGGGGGGGLVWGLPGFMAQAGASRFMRMSHKISLQA